MKSHRLAMLFLITGLAFMAVAIATMTQPPTVINADVAVGDNVLVFQSDPNHLQDCGAFETLRILKTPELAPESVTSVATSTPDPNAPTPAPTSTPRPAPTEDRVGFPENYATEFKLLFVFDRPDRQLVRAICGNDIAAQHQEGEEFAYGSVLLMISYSAQLDADGQPVLDESGHFIGEKLVALHVMRKGEGFGEAYGEDRAGEWEFVAFNGDGSYQNLPETTNFCAACHMKEGGESVDHVFRMNLFHEGESALVPPLVGANEISIYLYGFHESLLEVEVGTTVTWVNNDEAAHTVFAAVMDDHGKVVPATEGLFASEMLPSITIEPGASFSFTFDQPGEYLYLCTVHKNMTGKIVVTE